MNDFSRNFRDIYLNARLVIRRQLVQFHNTRRLVWDLSKIADLSAKNQRLADNLMHLAHLKTGELKRPELQSGPPWANLSALCIPGEHLALQISEAMAHRIRDTGPRGYRVLDIPNPSANYKATARPRLLVEQGQELVASQAWLWVPVEAWSQGVNGEPHCIDETLQRLGFEGQESSGYTLYVGPDEHGTVLNAELHEYVGPLGGIEGWRASLCICRSDTDIIGMLPDGRFTSVDIIPACDLAYDSLGAVAAVLHDPLEATAPFGADDECWFDGRSGELIESTRTTAVHVLRYRPRLPACTADGRLKFRLLDGDGIPSDGSAPSITQANRMWLSAAYPEIAAQCYSNEKKPLGIAPPFLPNIQHLLSDLDVSTLREGPEQWRHTRDSRAEIESTLDPVVKRPWKHNINDPKQLRLYALHEWKCSCGQLVGVTYAGITCALCRMPVIGYPRDLSKVPSELMTLSTHVVHPWYKRELAGILGLTIEEMRELIGTCGHDIVRKFTLAVTDPEESLSFRLTDETCAGKILDLGKALAAIRVLNASSELRNVSWRTLIESPWIDTVPVPHAIERMIGTPPGSTANMVPALVRQFRAICQASRSYEQLHELGSSPITLATWVQLQESVDDYYGARQCSCFEAGDVSSLSGLIRRLWPTTRQAALSYVIPGMYRRTADRQPSQISKTECLDGVMSHPSSDLSSTRFRDTIAPPNYIDGEAGPVRLPFPERALDVGSRQSWLERWSFMRLLSRYIPTLGALCDAASELRIAEDIWTKWHWPASLPRRELGRVVQRRMWQSLESKNGSPRRLLLLLEGQRDATLDKDHASAVLTLEQKLQKIFAPSHPGNELVVYCFARVLAGWTKRRISIEEPNGDRWSLDELDEDIESRVLPPADSNLWGLLPNHDLICNPVEWFCRASDGQLSSEVARGLLRFANAPLPAEWWEHQDASLAKVETEPMAEPDVEFNATLKQLDPDPSNDASPQRETGDQVDSCALVFTGAISAWLKSTEQLAKSNTVDFE